MKIRKLAALLAGAALSSGVVAAIAVPAGAAFVYEPNTITVSKDTINAPSSADHFEIDLECDHTEDGSATFDEHGDLIDTSGSLNDNFDDTATAVVAENDDCTIEETDDEGAVTVTYSCDVNGDENDADVSCPSGGPVDVSFDNDREDKEGADVEVEVTNDFTHAATTTTTTVKPAPTTAVATTQAPAPRVPGAARFTG